MHILPAELPDINICYQLNKSYNTDYVWQMQTRSGEHTIEVRFDTVRLPRSMRVEYPRNPDELLEHWQQENCFFVIRNTTDEAIGFIDAHPFRWLNVLWITNLVIDSRYRRRGLGTKLLKTAVNWARAQQLGQLTLEMQTKNHPAICFAEKNGFHFSGFNEQYYANGDIALFFARSI